MEDNLSLMLGPLYLKAALDTMLQYRVMTLQLCFPDRSLSTQTKAPVTPLLPEMDVDDITVLHGGGGG